MTTIPDPQTGALAVVLDAAEDWAAWTDTHADNLAAHGREGRRVADIHHAEANLIRAAVLAFRPLRERDPETGEWKEGG